MINPIRHFGLTSHKTIYDEEALSSLELMGRVGGKINEIIDKINELNKAVDELPFSVEKAVADEINNGNLSDIVGPAVLFELGASFDDLNTRISRIIASSGNDNTEVVDMRTGHTRTYDTAGDHIRALADGTGFSDAVRPGTVQHGRIMAGMLGGDLAADHTLQMAIPMAGKWAGSGYYDRSTLSHTTHSGYAVTANVPCKYGDTFVLESYLFGPRVYPAAVFNAAGQVIEVIGTPGKSSWDVIHDAVSVTKKDAAYIRFVCGVGYESKFRAYRVQPETETDLVGAMGSKGYLHMTAKNRTDTVTDRAQIKVWFERPQPMSADEWYTIPLRLYKHENLSGYTFRLFASTTTKTYDQALPLSAAGYSFDPDKGIEISTKAPLTVNGVIAPYICLFIDLIAADPEHPMEVYLPRPLMNGIQGVGYSLHGSSTADHLRKVAPSVNKSPLYQKRILGVGDSLMSGNTIGSHKSWFDLSAGLYDMVYHNAAVNGRSVAEMAESILGILNVFPNPDYFVLNGGANDLRLGVPIESFREAISTIIASVRTNNPRVKILALTNWQRSGYVNDLGLIESDYVEAMLEMCESLNVLCLNNYADSLNLMDGKTASWADQGIVSGGSADLHFSEEANIHLMPRICAALESL